MAFLKYAKAKVQKPSIQFAEWDALRRKAVLPSPEFQHRTAQVILSEYDPSKYMLSHATIVASVDVEQGPGKMGEEYLDGFQVRRKYGDYYVTPETTQFINNNNDAFERQLLMASFKTFIGAQSYVEHVQIPELSKGRIIDAAARDVGGSVYVDILIANELKHAPLIRAIKSGQLGTLSMGCFTPGAQVTMADGIRLPIEEVSVGDMVLTHKGRHREVTAKMIKVGDYNLKRIRVVGSPDPITTTPNHPFFVLRPPAHCVCGCGEEIEYRTDVDPSRRASRRFKKGHQLRVYNPQKVYSLEEARERKARLSDIVSKQELVEVRADELLSGDLVCFPKLSDGAGSIEVSNGKARLLGYFLAEGSFLKHKGNRTEVQFNFSMSEKHTFVSEVVDLLRTEFPGSSPWVQDREGRDTCVVHVTGSDTVEWFFTHGGEYSHLKRLSSEAMQWSKAAHESLIGAWLNGDGTSRSDSSGLSGVTTSYNLACQMHVLMARCGAHARIYCRFEGRASEISQAVNSNVSLRGEDRRLAAFTLNSTQNPSEIVTSKNGKKQAKSVAWRQSDTHIFFQVKDVQTVSYTGPVYDMEVEEDHSYLVEGVAVHNCTTSSTTCTKCGNVAEDETQLCPCIRFFKGSKFVDPNGIERKVAELCGHFTDPSSVRFIEASWVANPAFKGAVLRNILSAEEIHNVEEKLHLAFSVPERAENDSNSISKAARLIYSFDPDDDFGEPQAPAEEEEDPIQKAVSDLTNVITNHAVRKVRDQINKSEVDQIKTQDPDHNDTLIRSAMAYPEWRKIAKVAISFVGSTNARRLLHGLLLHKQGGWKKVAAENFTGREILAISRMLDLMTKKASMAGEGRVYRTVLQVGGPSLYENEKAYLAACRRVLGRSLTGNEAYSLLEKGRLFALGRSRS